VDIPIEQATHENEKNKKRDEEEAKYARSFVD
jgi:hypothetical protein